MKNFSFSRFLGTPVSIHWSFFAALGIGIYWIMLQPGANKGKSLLILLFAVISLVLHELGHALAAKALDIKVGGVTLHFFGGITRLDPLSMKGWKEIPATLGGPLLNLVFASASLVPVPIIGIFGRINLAFGVINLVPAWPLDGGRLMRAVLALRIPRGAATMLSLFTGLAFSFALFVYGLLKLETWAIAISVYIAMVGLGAVRTELEAEMTEMWRSGTGKGFGEGKEEGEESKPFAKRLSRFRGSLGEFLEMERKGRNRKDP